MTNTVTNPRLLSLCVLLLFVCVSSAWALDPSQPVSSYVRSRFIENGISTVYSITQSRDGFLWFTSDGRLVRFDGFHFTVFDQPPSVGSMALGPDGDLWIGTMDHVERIPAAALNQSHQLPTTTYHLTPIPGVGRDIICFHFTRSGVLWLGASGGLYRFEHGAFSLIISGRFIHRIEEASNGHLLITTGEGFLEWDGSRIIPHPEMAAQLGVKAADVFHVFEDSRGVTWFCTAKGVARRARGYMEKLAPWGPHGHGVYRAYEDPSGAVWFTGAEGLFRGTTAGLELAAAGMNARYIYGDRDGNLWVGTNGDGLYRFQDRTVRMFTTADGLPGKIAMTVLATHDGTLWTGFNCGGLSRFDGHSFRIYKEKDGLLNSCVWSLAEDSNHDLWIGTYGGGVFRMHEGRFTQYSKPEGLASDKVVVILAARDGSVWCGTPGGGLSRIQNGHIHTYSKNDGLSARNILSLHQDRAGNIWAGTPKGVDRLTGDRFVNFSSLPKAIIYQIGEDRSGSLYFSVEFGKSVYRIENNQVIGVASKLDLFQMVETEQGEMWFAGNGTFHGPGLSRIPAGGLDHPHQEDDPLDRAQFGSVDGMDLSMSDGRPDLAVTRDGKLWAATEQGLAMLDLRRLPRTDRTPVIYVREVTIVRNTRSPGQELAIPPGTHHLELWFDAIELTSPERIRLQYRLDGVESEWLDPPTPTHAFYTNMPPGRHAFHIRACNRDGIWDRTGIVYYITQQPYFYETVWFRVAMVMAGLLFLWGLYRRRLRQATARVTTRLEGRLAERSRIARELHDTLLQSFQGVVFLFQGATNSLPDGEAKQKFEGALDQAEQAIIEGRDAVHEMRSSEAVSELSAAIHAFAEELANVQTGEGSPVIQVRVEGTPRSLNPILYDEIYRIAVEALRNAFQHAQADQIEVAIIYGERQLVLRVRDDGKGIDADILHHGRAEHFGLPGMRERAIVIGASLEVRSKARSGTEVELAIPASVAYAKSPAPRHWFFGRFGRKETRS